MVNNNCSKSSKSRNKKTNKSCKSTKRSVGGNGNKIQTNNEFETNTNAKYYIDLISFFSTIKNIIFGYFNYVLEVIIDFFKNVDNNNSKNAILVFSLPKYPSTLAQKIISATISKMKLVLTVTIPCVRNYES